MKKNTIFNKYFKSHLISTLLLAVIPAGIIILIQPINFEKYKITLNQTTENHNRVDVFQDIDGDGKQEFFRLYDFKNASLGLMIYDSDDNSLGQFNSKYNMPEVITINKVLFDDLNGDNIKEIIFFTQNTDSLFLSIFNYSTLDFLIQDRFITSISLNEKSDYYYKWIISEDVDKDKHKDIFFTVNAGFALYPRKIFRYDYVKDKLISSVNCGGKHKLSLFHNEDNEPIFYSTTNATSNCSLDFPFDYQDTCSWLLAFNKDLELLFEPVSFLSYPNSLSKIFSYENGFFFYNHNRNTEEKGSFYYLDFQGNLIDTFVYNTKMGHFIKLNIEENEKFFMSGSSINSQLKYYEFNPLEKKKFKSKHSKNLENLYYYLSYDVDFDGEQEHFFRDNSRGDFFLYRNDLSNSVKIDVREGTLSFGSASSQIKEDIVKLIISSKKYIYIYSYFKNPVFYYRYIFWIIIYLLSIIFIWFVQLIPRRILKKQTVLKNKIINLQLKNTQNQLDPHFTFNALNVVASKIYKEDRKTAYDLFERFSRLMRSSLAFSDKIFRPLSEEMQFTEDYLEFQKTRFEDLFDFEINFLNNVETDKIKVPKMIIQGFAENCVKHAFRGINYIGHISINITKEEEKTKITIEDDGIGIKQSNLDNPEPESGYGIVTMKEQIALINKLYHKEIHIKISDKSELNSTKFGTEIKITL